MITPSDVYEIDELIQAGQPDRALESDGVREVPPETNNVLKFWTVCPWSDSLTQYDVENIYVFARLLDLETEGANLDEMAASVFATGRRTDRDRSLRIAASHLARAHWLLDNEFPFLNW